VTGLEQLENAELSKLHSNLIGGVPPEAVNWNVIWFDEVELRLATGLLFPSIAEVIVICGGGVGVGPITETLLLPLFVTYMCPLFGLKAINCGADPTVIVATTVFVVVSITEIVLLPKFTTYMCPLLGLNAIPSGPDPTVIVATTVFVVVSITETVLLPKFVTYISPLFGLKAIPTGPFPTAMVFITESAQALSIPKKLLDNANIRTTHIDIY
jgi:hypothetical protein